MKKSSALIIFSSLISATFSIEIFLVPSFKPASDLALRLYSDVERSGKGHFRYGMQGHSTNEVRSEITHHYEHLMQERLKFAWINSASQDFDLYLASILFLSNIHAKVKKQTLIP